MAFPKSYKKIASPVFFLLCGGILGWGIAKFSLPLKETIMRGDVLRQKNTPYKFINPILSCELGPETAFPEFKPIKDALQDLIAAKIANNEASSISLYMRSLNKGRWFTINDDVKYAPASLLKVFVMMAYYNEAEDHPEILKKAIRFKGADNIQVEFPEGEYSHLKNGEFYTIEKIIEQMILYSDNDSLNTLVDNIDTNALTFLNAIFSDLNIPSPLLQKDSDIDFMPVSNYAMVFRVLFGSTYLNREFSEKALQLLSRTHYKNGIGVGIPPDITVSHKYGVYATPGKYEVEFHDCGIVYYPSHPYLLCIMTHGNDLKDLQKVIQDISKRAYQEADRFWSQVAQ